LNDSQIVDLYWQRSPLAIEETDKKYGAYCGSIAYRICQNREDAEECVNDTWLSAWNAMPDKRPEALPPFLGRITRNHAVNRVLKKTRQKRGGGEAVLALEELEDCVQAKGDPGSGYEQKELEQAINRFLSGLKAEERRIFLGRYWYLYPVAELAERLGFSQAKVKSSLFRIRKRLRAFLEKEELL